MIAMERVRAILADWHENGCDDDEYHALTRVLAVADVPQCVVDAVQKEASWRGQQAGGYAALSNDFAMSNQPERALAYRESEEHNKRWADALTAWLTNVNEMRLTEEPGTCGR